jgi:hypothetical protein
MNQSLPESGAPRQILNAAVSPEALLDLIKAVRSAIDDAEAGMDLIAAVLGGASLSNPAVASLRRWAADAEARISN